LNIKTRQNIQRPTSQQKTFGLLLNITWTGKQQQTVQEYYEFNK